MNKIKDMLRKILPEDFILWTHKARGILAAFLYGFPAKKLKVIGVTGTNGKTTTCNLIAKLLETDGKKVGLATTINFKIGQKEWKNNSKMTTINPFLLQKLLKDMVSEKCEYAIIETTSHAIKQFRHWGIKYYGVILTNLTHDHLDYHKGMTDYRDTKLELFSHTPDVSIINRDDPSYIYFAKKPAKELFLYAVDDKADVTAKKIIYEEDKTSFALIIPDNQISITLHLPGKFNIYNALAAASFGLSQKMTLSTIKNGLESVKGIAGRMETIKTDKKFTVIIDFAHTPDGLQKVFETVKQFAKGKIIHVGGATGQRDKTKRPLLGALAGRFADIVFVTNEDPYDEDPWQIIEEVAQGVARGSAKKTDKVPGKNFFKVLDRKQAIKMALTLAKKDDLVLITGKGAEEVMAVGNRMVPYSDKKVVEEILGK